MTFHGTLGELTLDEAENCISLEKFGEEAQRIDTKKLSDNGYGHGGGDYYLIQTLYDMMLGKTSSATALTASIESHLMGICAEESRLENGKLIYVHK